MASSAKPIIRVWWNPEVDDVSLGEFLVARAREYCCGESTTIDLVVDRTLSTSNFVYPDLRFRVSREDGKTIIERIPMKPRWIRRRLGLWRRAAQAMK